MSNNNHKDGRQTPPPSYEEAITSQPPPHSPHTAPYFYPPGADINAVAPSTPTAAAAPPYVYPAGANQNTFPSIPPASPYPTHYPYPTTPSSYHNSHIGGTLPPPREMSQRETRRVMFHPRPSSVKNTFGLCIRIISIIFIIGIITFLISFIFKALF